MVPVISPLQLSLAVGMADTVAEHSPVTSGRTASVGTGALLSSTTTDWVWELVFPLPSL